MKINQNIESANLSLSCDIDINDFELGDIVFVVFGFDGNDTCKIYRNVKVIKYDVCIYNDSVEISYLISHPKYTEGVFFQCDKKDIFKTEEEAQAECDRRNVDKKA